MREIADFFKDFLGMIMASIGAVAWMIRLESRNALNAEAIEALKRQRHDDLMAARDARDATSKRLDEIRSDLVEVRDDIKTLIRAMK